jgi:hypothetical protein
MFFSPFCISLNYLKNGKYPSKFPNNFLKFGVLQSMGHPPQTALLFYVEPGPDPYGCAAPLQQSVFPALFRLLTY